MPAATLPLIKKCVAFVCIGDEKEAYVNGTGFFVNIPTGYDENMGYRYFVTAKHVIQDEKGNVFTKIGLRINTLSDKSEIVWDFQIIKRRRAREEWWKDSGE